MAVAARAARVSDGGARPVVCERDGEGERRWERSRGFQGGAWRHRGVEEEPGRLGGRRWPGRVAARATEQLRGEGEEDDRGRSGGGLGRTGAGPAGLPGERQVVPPLFPSLFYFLQFVFYLIATEFKFKQI